MTYVYGKLKNDGSMIDYVYGPEPYKIWWRNLWTAPKSWLKILCIYYNCQSKCKKNVKHEVSKLLFTEECFWRRGTDNESAEAIHINQKLIICQYFSWS